MFFIVLGACALVVTLLWLWQSLREAVVQSPQLMAAAGEGSSAHVSSERAKLLAEKQSLLLALKDLSGERDAGKLSEEDFSELNNRYRARAREVLKELDGQLAPYREQARKLIEGALANAGTAPAAAASSRACPSCSVVNDTDAVFCKKCGTRLSEASA
jgi:hypothetical protein